MRANVATVATTHPIGTHLILCEGDPRNFLAKNRRPPPEKAYSFAFFCEHSIGDSFQCSVFSVQCSVRRKFAGAARCLPPRRVRQRRTSRHWRRQVWTHWECVYWVGLDGSKLGKEFCTTLHIPEHAYTSQHDSGTSPHNPVHAYTFLHARGTAVAESQAVVQMGFTALKTLLLPPLGRTSGRLGRVSPRD